MTAAHEYFPSAGDRELLRLNNLETFAKLWQAELQWFEEPNFRRSGWSGVARHELRRADGTTVGIFVKRQANHQRRTFKSPGGCPTFRSEWQNLKKLSRYQIPVPQLLYYGECRENGESRAILITYELQGYLSLDALLKGGLSEERNRDLRAQIIVRVAEVVRRFHDHRFRHNCLYPKHLMLKIDSSGALATNGICFIDLEKSRQVLYPQGARIRDLDTLMRRCPEWTDYEKDLFFNYYLKLGLEQLQPAPLARALERWALVKRVKRRIKGKIKPES
ncbi:MAG: hypothetical protein JXR80_03810 [Deltaproteobacteria bacterium]|nr:hypothetical protein [Deltaproteobacteria bacterium]